MRNHRDKPGIFLRYQATSTITMSHGLPDHWLFLALIAVFNSIVVVLHALRGRFTLAPFIGVAGAYVFLLWRFLELGWWTQIGKIQINAAHGCLVPPILLGVTLTYAMDGLKTARAYLLVILLGALLSWGLSWLRELLSSVIPMPYALVYSNRSHLGLTGGLLLGMVGSVTGYELARARTPRLALALGFALGMGVWLIVSSFIEYGWMLGKVNIRLQALGMAVSSGFAVMLAGLYAVWALARGIRLPPRPIAELFSLWRGVESNLREQDEPILDSARVISELKALNRSLQESERQRDYQMQATPLGVLYTDAKGGIAAANPAAAEIFGRAQADLPGLMLPRLLEEHFRQSVALDALAERPAGWTLTRGDGAARWYDLTVLSVYDARRHRCGYHVLLKEVTEREAARRREMMESRVKEIHKTGKVLAHDFSNLLMGAEATLDVLAAESSGREKATDCIQRIRQAIDRAREMLTRIHSATFFAPELERHEINALAREAVELSRAAAARKGVGLDFSGCAPIAVDVDASLMTRVLTNLLHNAVRASPEGGRVAVAVEPDEGGGVFVRMTDQGGGMSDEEIQRAFDPGFTTKGEGQGGLGLAIGYLIVDAHDGHLQIRRNTGAGLTVVIWLPPSLADEAGRAAGVLLAIADAAQRDALLDALDGKGIPAAEIHQPEEIGALLRDDPTVWGTLLVDATHLDWTPENLPAGFRVLALGEEGARIERGGGAPERLRNILEQAGWALPTVGPARIDATAGDAHPTETSP